MDEYEWNVYVSGYERDIEFLTHEFAGAFRIVKFQKSGILTAERWANITEANVVKRDAELIVQSMNGYGSLYLPGFQTVKAGNIIYKVFTSGRRDATVLVDPFVIKLASFNPPQSGTSAQTKNVSIASPDGSAVNKVLAAIGVGDADFVSLYKVFEVVQQELGGRRNLKTWVERNCVATADEVDNFCDSANDPGLSGSSARHSIPVQRRGSGLPMSLGVAEKLIKKIARRWIEEQEPI